MSAARDSRISGDRAPSLRGPRWLAGEFRQDSHRPAALSTAGRARAATSPAIRKVPEGGDGARRQAAVRRSTIRARKALPIGMIESSKL